MSRTITPRELEELGASVTVIDVRRRADYDADSEVIPGAAWRDPDKVDDWAKDVRPDNELILYCVRGGSVSNAVLNRLLARKIRARYLEGGILGWKAAGLRTIRK